MNLEARIARRQRGNDGDGAVSDFTAINPVVHPSEPVGRGRVIEQLLDALSPIFSSQPPTDSYVWGPKGTGKTAVVRPLFEQLSQTLGRGESQLYTATRAAPESELQIVYIDARRGGSPFSILHAAAESVAASAIPKQGVGIESVRTQLREQLSGRNQQLLVGVDHLGEPETPSVETALELFETFSSVGCLAVGRNPPAEAAITDRVDATVSVEPYTNHALIEVLTNRVADGGFREKIDDERLTEIATWATGDAHDALAALFGAGKTAETTGVDQIGPKELATGMAAVPRPSVAVGRVLALPANRKQIIRRLLALDEQDRRSVRTAARSISTEVSLSQSTTERLLYELAESGCIRRVKTESTSRGRPPSRLEPRFPTLVFNHMEKDSSNA